MTISQADGARLMAAHEKAMAMGRLHADALIRAKATEPNLRREWRTAQSTFAELVSKLTEPEA